jgi:hypothetical protein
MIAGLESRTGTPSAANNDMTHSRVARSPLRLSEPKSAHQVSCDPLAASLPPPVEIGDGLQAIHTLVADHEGTILAIKSMGFAAPVAIDLVPVFGLERGKLRQKVGGHCQPVISLSEAAAARRMKAWSVATTKTVAPSRR